MSITAHYIDLSLGVFYQSIGNYSVRGIICFIVTEGKEGGQCEAQSQIPIVILCRQSVNELVWNVMNEHICTLLATKLVALFICSLVLDSIGPP